jgi:hypothetical protein
MGAAGRERFERDFTLDRWVKKTRSVYESVLARSEAR